MNGAKPASAPEGNSAPAAAPAAESTTPVGPGFGRLLQGAPRSPAPAPSPVQKPPHGRPFPAISRALFWTMLAADLLLLILAASVILTTRGRVPLWTLALAASAISLGAWLGCYAVWSSDIGRRGD